MKKLFSISEAAALAGLTSETLRHYDRIGLVRPGERDEWTGYRYYSEQELVRLYTIQALRCMDLSLKDIRRVLEYDDLEKIIAFLRSAEQSADAKIARLQYAKEKIKRARADYEKKLAGPQEDAAPFVRHMPKRVLLLSDTLQHPALDNLWRYHDHFYAQLGPKRRDAYTFEDVAGIYTAGGVSRLFAVCLRWPDTRGLTILPAGDYLCASCCEADRQARTAQLQAQVRQRGGRPPAFVVEQVVITGILQWSYQVQVPLPSGLDNKVQA
mgnify:CR=1 FL=1